MTGWFVTKGGHAFTKGAFMDLLDRAYANAIKDVLTKFHRIIVETKKTGNIQHEQLDAIVPMKWNSRLDIIKILENILNEMGDYFPSDTKPKLNNRYTTEAEILAQSVKNRIAKIRAGSIPSTASGGSSKKPTSSIKRIEISGDESPLHKLGYRVGITEGQSSNVRRNHLDDCYKVEFLGKFKDQGQWGNPNTEMRLKKMANHISSMISLKTRDDPKKYQHAINDWVEDLEYLYDNYYLAKKYKFKWPTVKR